MKKVPATFDFENSLWVSKKEYIVGIDEVGRGAWAGPLVAGAVIFPKSYRSSFNFYDSKLLSSSQRETLAVEIQKEALCFSIGQVEVSEIIQLGLTQANQLAYERAIGNLNFKPDHYLIDAFYLQSFPRENQTPIIHGDVLSASIAAASIIAKVYRDNLMRSLDKNYIVYKFAANKGYGTTDHQQAIRQFGLSDLHRTNYNLRVYSSSEAQPNREVSLNKGKFSTLFEQ